MTRRAWPPNLRERFERLLLHLPDWSTEGEREAFLKRALSDHEILFDLQYVGSANEAASRLLDLYQVRGPEPFSLLLVGLREAFADHPVRCREIAALTADFRKCTQRRREKWDSEPYRGLAHFDKRHAPIFFGREEEVEALIQTVKVAAEQGLRFTVVTGASGSGKSSLVRAGLWARLAAGDVPEFPGCRRWLIHAMTPKGAIDGPPLVSLRDSLLRALDERDGFEGKRAVVAERFDGTPLADLAELLLPPGEESRWLLILDQMEELFVGGGGEERQRETAAFLDRLLTGVNPGRPSRFQVVATIRSDFSHHCLDGHRALSHAFRRPGGEYKLPAPGRLALERMVSGPLTELQLAEPWTLDSGLAPAMAADAESRPGGLALMAFAVRELYDLRKRDGARRLDLDTYRSPGFGGLGGAIKRRADETMAKLGAGGEAALDRVFARLVHANLDDAPTRRRARRSIWDADGEAQRLVKEFEEARLLVADQGIVEVAHEALLREWPRLAGWIEERREAFWLAERVRTEVKGWDGGPVRIWPASVIDEIRGKLARAGLLGELLDGDAKVARLLTPEADWIIAELRLEATTDMRRMEIGLRLAKIGDPRPGIGVVDGVPDILWRAIPGVVGQASRPVQAADSVEPFCMAAFPVTVGQFRAFLHAKDGFDNKQWWKDLKHEERAVDWGRQLPNHPVTDVSWFDATAFCRWLSVRLGREVRLPDEQEWEWAARSARADYEYPWGREWREGAANTYENGPRRLTAVGMYPAGDSLQGVSDLAGNVQEWCGSQSGKSQMARAEEPRELRGGSWELNQVNARAACRDGSDPNVRFDYFGLRVVCSSPITGH